MDDWAILFAMVGFAVRFLNSKYILIHFRY